MALESPCRQGQQEKEEVKLPGWLIVSKRRRKLLETGKDKMTCGDLSEVASKSSPEQLSAHEQLKPPASHCLCGCEHLISHLPAKVRNQINIQDQSRLPSTRTSGETKATGVSHGSSRP